jgi:hypothetical protein
VKYLLAWVCIFVLTLILKLKFNYNLFGIFDRIIDGTIVVPLVYLFVFSSILLLLLAPQVNTSDSILNRLENWALSDSPIVSVPAKVVSKRSEMQVLLGCSYARNFIAFELESGERREFQMLDSKNGASDYGLLIEQDIGILSYKEKNQKKRRTVLYKGFQRQITDN